MVHGLSSTRLMPSSFPPDLQAALDATPGAVAAYEILGDSAKRQYLWWIHSAKRPTTRADRIEETIRRLSPDGSRNSV
jgi:uncharacterized protein YdeI (YjbR/CyaY-like superfamily)